MRLADFGLSESRGFEAICSPYMLVQVASIPLPNQLEFEMSKLEEAPNTDIVAGFAALRQDVAALVSSMNQILRGEAGDIIEDVRKAAVKGGADVKTQVGCMATEFEAGVQRNPLTAVLIAFGVGALFAFISKPNK